MAWLYNNKTIQVGRSWTDSKGVKHPRTWSNWTAERKAQVGLTFKADPVVESYDERFFSAPGVQRSLTDKPVVDEAGKAVMDMDGNPMVTEGLKPAAIKQVKVEAGGRLSETDWYVIRAEETGEPVPQEVRDSRAAIRAAANDIETKINNAKSHTAFTNLYNAPVDAQGNPTGPAPINAWPGAK
jgi:hypothetical protein